MPSWQKLEDVKKFEIELSSHCNARCPVCIRQVTGTDKERPGFDKGHLQVSFALFVGSVVSYFVFKDKQNSEKDDKMHEIYENAVISEMEEEMIRKVDREIEEEAIKKVD